MSSTPSERSLQSKRASHLRWARVADPKAETAPARKGFDARFERELDEMGVTDPDDRARRLPHLRKAYFADLARSSARKRREVVESRRSSAA